MKKFLPLALFFVGLLVFVGVYFLFIRGGGSESDEDAFVPEIPFEQRPFTQLIPSEDGHWLKLIVEGIGIEAESMDYELLYRVEGGMTQGVPGSISLDGKKGIERDLLLGSESSGKFRYDEGVEQGTLTLRFRNGRGKLVGKLSTDFALQTETQTLASVDGQFSYKLDKTSKETFFVTLNVFGLPKEVSLSGDLLDGPYGIFTSDESKHSGKVVSDGNWQELETGTSAVGVFVNTSE